MALEQDKRVKKSGFRLRNLPEDAYKGQQQKIKQNLIQKAKLKRQYAKVLRDEHAVDQDRIATTYNSNETTRPTSSEPAKVVPVEEPAGVALAAAADQSRRPPDTEQTGQSYRQRAKARKANPLAGKVQAIKHDRQARHEDAIKHAADVANKRAHRSLVNKRQTSKTKTGQPVMRDRMKNILDKLQA